MSVRAKKSFSTGADVREVITSAELEEERAFLDHIEYEHAHPIKTGIVKACRFIGLGFGLAGATLCLATAITFGLGYAKKIPEESSKNLTPLVISTLSSAMITGVLCTSADLIGLTEKKKDETKISSQNNSNEKQ